MTMTEPTQKTVLPGPEHGPWALFECLPDRWREFQGIMDSVGVPTFIPTTMVSRRQGLRDCRVETPLWYNYGFLRGGHKVIRFAEDTERLVSIAPAWSKDMDKELQNIVNAINSGVVLTPSKFQVGKKVIVSRGLLACGDLIRGTIVDGHDGKLYVNAGGMWAYVEVDADDCDPIQ